MKITEAYFDVYWVLQRVLLDMSIDIVIEDAIASGTIDDVRSAGGELIDKFIKGEQKR